MIIFYLYSLTSYPLFDRCPVLSICTVLEKYHIKIRVEQCGYSENLIPEWFLEKKHFVYIMVIIVIHIYNICEHDSVFC